MLKAVGWVPLQGHSPPFSPCSVPPTGRTPGGGSSGEEDWDPGPTAPIPWLHPHLPPGSSHPSPTYPTPPPSGVAIPPGVSGILLRPQEINPLLCFPGFARFCVPLTGAVLRTVTLVTRLLTIKIMKTKVSFNRQIDT